MPRHSIGLDLGQTTDHTALAILEKSQVFDRKGYLARDHHGHIINSYDCVHLMRYPLGTPYPTIVTETASLTCRPELKPGRGDTLALAIDQTGVGGPVLDLFRREEMPAQVVGVTITAGSGSRWDEFEKRAYVPKIELVGLVQAQLQTGRLKIIPSLTHAALLQRELLDFQVKITVSANETFGAWRDGQHDDLVLAVALASWLGERQPSQPTVAVSRRFPAQVSRDRPTGPSHPLSRSINQKISCIRRLRGF